MYNLVGGYADTDYILVGAVLDCGGNDNIFPAIKQILDIGKKKYANPNATIDASEFNIATAGAICCMPKYDSAFYDGYPFKLLWSKNKDVQHGTASTAKILTVATGLPFIGSLGERITIINDDVEAGSGDVFGAGDILTVNDILYGIMFWSSNTCAQAFARYVGAKILNNQSAIAESCVSAFVAEMNRVAISIGCSNSAFDTPSGKSATSKTSVSDLLKIIIHASSFRALNDVWNKTTHTINIEGTDPRQITGSFSVTTNSTINAGYFVFGGKPGSLTIDGNQYSGIAIIAKPKAS